MSLKTVDARNKLCPQPLILTKKALSELVMGQSMVVLINNETSRQNVERFCADNGAACTVEKEGDTFKLTVQKLKDTPVAAKSAAEYCTEPKGSHVICFKNDKMGMGDDALGTLLIKGFINTIKETEPLPETIVFYNAGIRLALEGSPVLAPLQELQQKGVRMLVCGTCADFFKQKENVKAGTISNMFDILTVLTRAGHIIYP
jgi:selenium metabolism protein YedF